MNKARYSATLVVALAPLLAAGCGKGLPAEADPVQAREALTAALEAWKEGRAPETLRDRRPPVDFRDVNWDRGSPLTGYLIKNEERAGVSVRFTVQLTLRQPDGTSRERVVAYTADAGQAVVIRPDF